MKAISEFRELTLDRLEEASISPGTACVASRRCLWLVCGAEGYGVRRATLGMATELQKQGVEVLFAALHDGSFCDEIMAAGHSLTVIGGSVASKGITQTGWRFAAGVVRLCVAAVKTQTLVARVIKRTQPDWVHFRGNRLLVSAGWAGLKTGTPVYWHLPNCISNKLPFGLQALGYRSLCRWLRVHPLPNSQYTAETLGLALRGTRVLYPGVDGQRFSPTAARSSNASSVSCGREEIPTFLIAARLTPEKAQDRVVEAAIQSLREGLLFQLILLGGPLDSPYCRQLQRRIAESRLSARIMLPGPTADPIPYYSACDVVINSRINAEPFGLSIIEAMLMERPVLAYNLGGPTETVLDDVTGWLVEDPSVEGYREGIRRALHDRERWASFGQAGRRRALKRFTLHSITSRYLDLVDEDRKRIPSRRPLATTSGIHAP